MTSTISRVRVQTFSPDGDGRPDGGIPVYPAEAWPELPLASWEATLDTVHMLTQIVGKVKLALTPFANEWWNVALHLTPRGLTTGTVPYGLRSFGIDFDFVAHRLVVQTSDGDVAALPLAPRAVADTYADLMATLGSLGIAVTISPLPSEVPSTIPFAEDRVHASYDPEYVRRWWRVMLHTERILHRFRTPFTGKSSPINVFWGSFDLCHTRFSGRPTTPPAAWPRFMQAAERRENFACGFWPGNVTASGVAFGAPAFYAYVFPEPPGIREAVIRPDLAGYDATLGQFIFRYEDARRAADPDAAILDFFRSSYEAAATLAGWDRAGIEDHDGDER